MQSVRAAVPIAWRFPGSSLIFLFTSATFKNSYPRSTQTALRHIHFITSSLLKDCAIGLWLHCYHTTTFPTFPTFFILSHTFLNTHLGYVISDNLHCAACRSASQLSSRSFPAYKTFGTHISSARP